MIFALGVLVAGLLALLFLPAFWRRAVRLSARRIEMQLPLSMSEIVAERDLLRAEFAVTQRRMEQRIEKLDEARARDMSELGRRSIVIAEREGALAALRGEIAALEGEVAKARAETVDAQAQMSASLLEAHDADAARAASVAAQQALLRDTHSVHGLSEERRLTIAGLETRLASIDMRVVDLEAEIVARDKNLMSRQAVIDRTTDERDRARAEAAGHVARIATLSRTLEERERHVSEIDDARAELVRAKAALERQLADSQRNEKDVLGREPEIRAGFERQIEAMRQSEKRLAAELDTIRAEKASLQGALETLRAELAMRGDRVVRRLAAVRSEPAAQTDESLRSSISELGAEVLRIAAALETPEAGTSAAPAAKGAAEALAPAARASVS